MADQQQTQQQPQKITTQAKSDLQDLVSGNITGDNIAQIFGGTEGNMKTALGVLTRQTGGNKNAQALFKADTKDTNHSVLLMKDYLTKHGVDEKALTIDDKGNLKIDKDSQEKAEKALEGLYKASNVKQYDKLAGGLDAFSKAFNASYKTHNA